MSNEEFSKYPPNVIQLLDNLLEGIGLFSDYCDEKIIKKSAGVGLNAFDGLSTSESERFDSLLHRLQEFGYLWCQTNREETDLVLKRSGAEFCYQLVSAKLSTHKMIHLIPLPKEIGHWINSLSQRGIRETRNPCTHTNETCKKAFEEIRLYRDKLFEKLNKETNLKTTVPINETNNKVEGRCGDFRCSGDFRSVVSANGKEFTLTPKQAEVIKMLHEAHENGTPKISLSWIIGAVYPDSKERKLKRLFRKDECFDALIENVPGRGLIRLKVTATKNATDRHSGDK